MLDKFTVAIIDNDPLVIFATKHMVKACLTASSILTYQNPEKFIADIEAEEISIPSVILCDYDMPEMTGLEVHDNLKNFLGEEENHCCFYVVSSEDNLLLHSEKFNSDFFCGIWEKSLGVIKVQHLINKSRFNIAS
ncbi:response regulator [Psychroflexus sp. CAK8W]|uniref:Response regulator n=1 Tax=Psychroflexus longus TaxID=2873596 RepID=A0ABS7XG73_9FLAO|nr:response regulator [Psychroflexus longus]MBZ9777424.1 response regulator [Psychroflexus longus]